MNVWFTSDTHYGHEKIVRLAGRPFSSVEEMNETMIERYNSLVRPSDLVYHGGDFAWNMKTAREVRDRLRGEMRMTVGNHDDIKRIVKSDVCSRYYLFRIFEKENFVLSHMPITKSQCRAGFNVHGHIHDKDSPESHQINICVEKTNYAPVHLDQILEQIRSIT